MKAESCNYIESLLGIETKVGNFVIAFPSCNYIESLLGIETAIQRPMSYEAALSCNYIESLLGIETTTARFPCGSMVMLQLYWIPIRDWNRQKFPCKTGKLCCNYIESLLGIETVGGEFWHRFALVATILNPY